MGIGMAGVMNVMHDGNHGSYSNKTGSINSWVVRFIFLQETCTTGRYNTMCTTPTNIPGHDEDLDGKNHSFFTKEAKWHSFHRFQQYYSVFLYGLLTFNWAITTDFRQMKTYLKENYPTVKQRAQKHFGRL
jgi:linoleoyl-CoA desaturase